MTSMTEFVESLEALDRAVKAARLPQATVLDYLQISRSTLWQWHQGRLPIHAHIIAKQLADHAAEIESLVEDGVLGVQKPQVTQTKNFNKKRYKEYFQ